MKLKGTGGHDNLLDIEAQWDALILPIEDELGVPEGAVMPDFSANEVGLGQESFVLYDHERNMQLGYIVRDFNGTWVVIA